MIHTKTSVADDLKLVRADFESPEAYQAAIEEVIRVNQDEKGLPVEGRMMKGGTFWTSKFLYTTTPQSSLDLTLHQHQHLTAQLQLPCDLHPLTARGDTVILSQ
eukprot:120256-Amphidinium_carterae.1